VAAFLAVFGDHWKIRAAGWGMFLSAGAIVLLMGIRNPFLMQVFVLVALWDLGRSRLKLWRLGVVGGGFMILFVLVALVRSGVDLSPDSLLAMGKFAQRSEVFGMAFKPIYVYIANNFWNLDFGVARIAQGGGHPPTWGASSLEAIFALMGISADLCERMGWDTFLNESNMKVHGLNTFTYLWPLYKDGGMFLALGFSWAWGAGMTWLYRKAVAGDPFDKLIYAYLLFAVGFSFFALYAQVGTYLLSGAILLGMSRMMRGYRLLPPLRMPT
jgi:oligosaccharide repeat unit polymerase